MVIYFEKRRFFVKMTKKVIIIFCLENRKYFNFLGWNQKFFWLDPRCSQLSNQIDAAATIYRCTKYETYKLRKIKFRTTVCSHVAYFQDWSEECWQTNENMDADSSHSLFPRIKLKPILTLGHFSLISDETH